jgi:hypothetical protein
MRTEQLRASIIKKFLSVWNVTYYDKQIPNQMRIPCMYFPIPISSSQGHSKETFSTSYTLNVNIFHTDEHSAYLQSEEIKSSIMRGKSVIAVYAQDGTQDGSLQIDGIEITEIGEGVVKLQLTYSDIIKYD